jgi:hypothetical protein
MTRNSPHTNFSRIVWWRTDLLRHLDQGMDRACDFFIKVFYKSIEDKRQSTHQLFQDRLAEHRLVKASGSGNGQSM